MSQKNPLVNRSVGGVAGVAIALSLIFWVLGEVCLPQYRSLMLEVFPQLPEVTQLTLDTYRYVLLGAGFSLLVWLLFRQNLLTEGLALKILEIIIACLLIYAVVGTFTLLLPLLLILATVG